MADVKRLNRLVEMLHLIDKNQKTTAKTLASRFGISERSVYRDIAALEAAKFPVYYDDEQSSYRFMEGFTLRKIELTQNEIRVMLAAKEVVSKLGQGVSNAYDSLMLRLTTDGGCRTASQLKNSPQKYWFDIDSVANFTSIEKQYDMIQKSLDDHVRLEISYCGMGDQEKKTRQIDPYGLFCSAGVWYVLAYCHLRHDIRQFALDCIKDIKFTDKYYALPRDFSMDKYFEGGWHIITYGDPVRIVLRFNNAVARWIKRKIWHPTQTIDEKRDGSILFSVTLNGTEEIRRWIYHWGPNCEVLKPAYFRNEVAEELKAMAKVYKK